MKDNEIALVKKILKKLTDITSILRAPYKTEDEFTTRLAYTENFLNVFNSSSSI